MTSVSMYRMFAMPGSAGRVWHMTLWARTRSVCHSTVRLDDFLAVKPLRPQVVSLHGYVAAMRRRVHALEDAAIGLRASACQQYNHRANHAMVATQHAGTQHTSVGDVSHAAFMHMPSHSTQCVKRIVVPKARPLRHTFVVNEHTAI